MSVLRSLVPPNSKRQRRAPVPSSFSSPFVGFPFASPPPSDDPLASPALSPEAQWLLDSTLNHVRRFNHVTQDCALSVHLLEPLPSDPKLASVMAGALIEEADARSVDNNKGQELEFLKLLRHYPELRESLISERTFQLTRPREEYLLLVAIRQSLGDSLLPQLDLIVAAYAVDGICLELHAEDEQGKGEKHVDDVRRSLVPCVPAFSIPLPSLSCTVSSRGSVFSSWSCPPSELLHNVKCWGLVGKEMVVTSPNPFVFGKEYTHAVWVRWNPSTGIWRTMLRNTDDHVILVEAGSNRLGFYSNRNGQFRPCGFDITPDSEWHFVVVVGKGNTNCSPEGVSAFYYDGVFVGNADRVACGTILDKFALDSQGPGYVSSVFLWSRSLPPEEIRARYDEGRLLHPHVGGETTVGKEVTVRVADRKKFSKK